jgi:membrane protein required for colicin V production
MNILTGLNAIDISIIVLVLLMSIKGIMNGFLREFFGFVGLIGGIFLASRLSDTIAKAIDSNLFHLENFAALKLIGFLAVLALVWGLCVFIGNIIVGVTKETPHSTLDRLFGFLIAGSKYFLIFALIISALFRSPLIKENMAKSIKKSQLYPLLDSVGSTLINLAPKQKKIEISTREES